jgi:hydroxymethylbilane synthase
VPIGVHTHLEEGTLTLIGVVASVDGTRLLKDTVTGSDHQAEQLGIELAQKMRQQGAQEILDQIFQTVQRS